MAIKDVLAVVDTGDKDEQFLRDALGFAEFHKASLSVVILSALPSADYAFTIVRPYAFLQDYTEAVEAKQERIGALARSTNVEIRTISDQPSVIFVKTAGRPTAMTTRRSAAKPPRVFCFHRAALS